MWDMIVSVPDHCLSFYFRRLNARTIPDTYSIPTVYPVRMKRLIALMA